VAASWRSAGRSSRPATASEDLVDYLIALVVCVLLFGYVVYVLIQPERF
jgi:K+-transporting ATPase KdpF subunit